MKTSLKWITPEADKEVGHMARVSNPDANLDDPVVKLIKYLISHKHWSPFEMACLCVYIETTRDIARQILRHRAFHFQEFSQRYSEAPEDPEFSEARLQDKKNRQNSIKTEDTMIRAEWAFIQNKVWDCCWFFYQAALKVGIAKELARKLLPEGLVKTRMYMQGTLRDWLFYASVRAGPETQEEHRDIAWAILALLSEHCPTVFQAADEAGMFPA